MASGRMLKKIVSTSKKLAQLKTDSARLLYTWLLAHLDIEGRFSAEPDIVKGYVVPRLTTMTTTKIKNYLQDMAENNLIILYKVNSDNYLELVKFKDFQTLREDREAESNIPSPDDSSSSPVVILSNSGLSKDKPREDKIKEEKDKYMDFVFLSKKEYKSLVDRFGEPLTKEKIENLNNYIGSKGKKYKSHYHTILSWDRKNERETSTDNSKATLFPIKGKTCGKPGCPLPAVYKDTSGAYDHFYCSGHMPVKVKEVYR